MTARNAATAGERKMQHPQPPAFSKKWFPCIVVLAGMSLLVSTSYTRMMPSMRQITTSVDIGSTSNISLTDDGGAIPKIVLLMSFPNSGTSYTMVNTQKMSASAVATNYVEEVKSSSVVPIHADALHESPYILNTSFSLHELVLTKTHCRNYCEQCVPTLSSREFEKGCLELTKNVNGTVQHVPYSSSLVYKAIHLFRNPFDNLVARMHLGIKKRRNKLNWTEDQLAFFQDTPEGLKAWCNYVDGEFMGDMDEIMQAQGIQKRLYAKLPCRTEWFRYIQWHNMAIEVLQQLDVPVLVLYYEDYTSKYNETVKRLLDFLKLEPINEPRSFVSGKTYESLYTDDMARKATVFAHAIASPECWQLVRHYFANHIDEPTTNLDKNEIENRVPQVAWLMSFPNSGTTYTLYNTEETSNTSTATNYGTELEQQVPKRPLVPIYSDIPDGPFIFSPRREIPSVILTKTHCTAYCDSCPIKASSQSIETFEVGCSRGFKKEKGEFVESYYPLSLPQRAVHLVRNPFDNIVSRMHHGIYRRREKMGWNEEQLSIFNDTVAGVHAWCAYIDKGFLRGKRRELVSMMSDEVRELAKKVPCFADLFRYVQWHNLAIEVTHKLKLPVHVLHYEDYTTSYDKTVKELFHFLNLTIVKENLDFVPGKAYKHFFRSAEIDAAERLIRAMASPDCWALLQRYFITPQKFSKAAWLISFPDSGSSYIMMNTQKLSGSAVATNYVEEVKSSSVVPIRSDVPDESPYMLNSSFPLPKLVLTNTHCTHYCKRCVPTLNTDDFADGCLMLTNTSEKGNVMKKFYSSSLVEKAVQLVRNPFDILVARKHQGNKKQRDRLKWTKEQLAPFVDSSKGLKAWCEYIDDEFLGDMDELMHERGVPRRLYADLPCRTELFRYIQWHNMAIEVLQQFDVPVLVLYYEDYKSKYNETVKKLFDFLELEQISEPRSFVSGKTYKSLYTDDLGRKAADYVRAIASPDCWELVRHYFNKWRDELSAVEEAIERATSPEIAWLLSFPNSGTSFTLMNVQRISNTSAATNYAPESASGELVPVRADLPNGPYLVLPQRQKVAPIVLTKSHCAAHSYCDSCPSSEYVQTLESFELGCRAIRERPGIDSYYYPETVPTRAVHLFRNPFDNLVARKHLGMQNRATKHPKTFWNSSMNEDTKAGLRAWCKYIDIRSNRFERESSMLSDETLALLHGVPCASEWYRYVQWHNLAIEMTTRLQLPVHILHYEDYTTHYNRTVGQLIDFLELPVVQKPREFVSGKTYKNLYDPADVRAATRLVRSLASPECWEHLRRYFVEWTDELELFEADPSPKVVWLMSFPNSGTSFTITNTELLSNTETATNYRDLRNQANYSKLFPELPTSPFVKISPQSSSKSKLLPSFILTKSHCGGYCDLCNQTKSLLTTGMFAQECAKTTTKTSSGDIVDSFYNLTIPKKAVHLIRNPFDNIVARMHLGIKKRRRSRFWSEEMLRAFNDTNEGLHAWCDHVDGRFREDARNPLFSKKQKKLLKGLPCYSEWFRYVQWHNLAVEVTEQLQLPVHLLHYEDYATRYVKTVKALLQFLQLRAVGEPKEFIPGKTYLDLFTADEAEAAAHFVRTFASPKTWLLLRRYFSQWIDDSKVPTVEQTE